MRKFSLSYTGFTLTELILALAIFSLVLVLLTGSFIGLTRTYSREQNKKQLNDSMQLIMEDVTKTLRSSSNGNNTQSSIGQYKQLCFPDSNLRYYWGNNGQDGFGVYQDAAAGLYKQRTGANGCGQSDLGAARETLLDDRYYVRQLSLNQIQNSEIYEVKLVVTTKKQGLDASGAALRCVGSANPESRTCAVQSLETVVNMGGI